MAKFINYYKILEVSPSDDINVIKEAYKRLSWLYHPDRNKNPGAEEKFKEISEAYTVLKDPVKRKAYDEQYYKYKDLDQDEKDNKLNRPRPVIDKPYIIFDDVIPGEIKTDSFTVRNSGGDYENIDISVQTPNSWVKITGVNSLNPNQSDELPIEIWIEVSADEWGKNYTEYIIIRLDDEETKVKVELNSKNKTQPPTFNKKKLIPIILIPIFFIIISCFSIYYISGLIVRQDDDVVETEDSSTEENVSSSNNGTEQKVVPKEFYFNGKVAYLKEGQAFDGSHDIDAVYIMDSKDNKEALINLDMYWVRPVSKSLSWSPDGAKLVIGFGMDLYIINVIDSSVKKIYSLKTDRVDDEDTIDNRGYFEIASWSPDGKKILVTVTPYNGQSWYGDEAVSNKIILVESDGSNVQILLENYKLRYLGTTWSPDGSKIIFSTGKSRHYHLLDEDGDVKESFDYVDYVKLWKMDLNNNNIITQIADFPGWQDTVNHDGYYVHNCKWSPDGKEVLFDLLYSPGAPSGYDVEKSMIYLMNPDGNNVEEFLQGYSPNWSVDCNKIIYGGISYNEDYELPIIVSDRSSGESKIIGWGFNPAWHSYD